MTRQYPFSEATHDRATRSRIPNARRFLWALPLPPADMPKPAAQRFLGFSNRRMLSSNAEYPVHPTVELSRPVENFSTGADRSGWSPGSDAPFETPQLRVVRLTDPVPGSFERLRSDHHHDPAVR